MSTLDLRPTGTRCTAACRPPADEATHCSVCHATIAVPKDFDRHRYGGWCLMLSSLGLVERAGLWASPEYHAAQDRAAAKRARDRTRRRQKAVGARTAPADASTHPERLTATPTEETR